MRQALIVGLAQLAAPIPGVSRSGATIVGGMLSGLNRSAATGFSFYLAIPTLGTATLYSLAEDFGAVTGGRLFNLTIGMVVFFITSLIALGWLLRYITKHDFKGFAVYRIIAGIAILLFFGWPWRERPAQDARTNARRVRKRQGYCSELTTASQHSVNIRAVRCPRPKRSSSRPRGEAL